jgi:predicted RNase H-like HicB family nuclease
MSKTAFTAVIEKTEDGWYIGQVEEFPEAISQGRTIKELVNNLQDALKMILEVRRNEFQRSRTSTKVLRRKIAV